MATGRPSRPGARWLAATAAAVVGCAMLVISGHASGASAAGVAFALFASLCYAVYAVTASYLITNGADDRAVVGAIFGGAAVLLMRALFTSPMSWVATGQGLAAATYLAVLTTALAYLLYARGAAHHGGDDRDHARPGRTRRRRGPRAGRSQRTPDSNRARWPWGSRRRPGHRGLARAAPHGRRHI
jgi:hypothetical protein